MTQPIPQDLDSEDAILGAMLTSPVAIRIAQDAQLQANHFYDPYNRDIYHAILALVEKGAEVEEVILIKQMREMGYEHRPSTIIDLAPKCPAVSNASHYAVSVVETAALRRLYNATTQIITRLEARTESPTALVNYALQEVDACASSIKSDGATSDTAADLSKWMIDHLEIPSDSIERFCYPWETLQQHTGGFSRGELIVLTGYSGDGKSVAAIQLLEKQSLDKLRVGYFSLEMPSSQIELRLIASKTGIPIIKLKNPWELNLEEKEAAKAAARELGSWDFEIFSGSITPNQIRAIQASKKFDLIIVDHLHRMPGSEDTQTLSGMVRIFKDIALDENCAVILLCQLNRAQDGGYPMPTPNRLKGSSSIMEESDAVIVVYRERDDSDSPKLLGSISPIKMRDGLTGYSIRVKLDVQRLKFVERANP